MSNKNIWFLVGAVILGLIAATMAYQHIQERAEVAAAEAAAQVQTYRETQVVVSQRDLDPGDRLLQQDMVLRSVPIDFVPADAVTYEEHEQYVNSMARTPIKQGAPLSKGALVGFHERFSRVITPGRVAFTLSVNEVNSIAGMVKPGDRIDVFLVFDSDQDLAGAQTRLTTGRRAVTVIENLLILATGNLIEEMVGIEGGGFGTITVEVEPQQAEMLAIAQASGSFRVILRNTDDQSPFGLDGLDQRDLLTRYGGNYGVEYIVGGH